MALVDSAGGAGITLIGVLFALSGVQHYFEGERINAEKITPIENIEPGSVAISGTIRQGGDGALTAPFTDRDCVAFEYRVTEVEGKAAGSEPVLSRGAESIPFVVADSTGRVPVSPETAELDLEKEEEIVVPREEEPPGPIAQFLSNRESIGEPTDPMVDIFDSSVGSRTYYERLLETGEDVYVFGNATREQRKTFGAHDFAIGTGVEGGNPNPETFIISDKPREEVGGGHTSGGRLAVVLGCFLIFIGCSVILGNPVV